MALGVEELVLGVEVLQDVADQLVEDRSPRRKGPARRVLAPHLHKAGTVVMGEQVDVGPGWRCLPALLGDKKSVAFHDCLCQFYGRYLWWLHGVDVG